MAILAFFKKRDNILLTIILFVAFCLRFYHLGFQSFWVDELHTMNEADPAMSWGELFSLLKCCDQHPPLFFMCERFLFILFGRSEVIARFLPALFGVLSVWAIYRLGKELLNKDLGLIAAALTSVNYFNIYYSQEARGYMLAFLGAVLSYLYFIRLVKYLRARDRWYYTFFALVTLYSHYYGLFVVASQFCIAFILLFAEKDKKAYLKNFALSGIVIAAVYALWLPFVLSMAQIQSFWISPINQDFIFTFFNTYFGNADLLKPVLVVALLFYVLNVFRSGKETGMDVKNNPLIFSFLLFTVSAFFIYILPYIRSVLVVPMLFDRYTIVLLPLFLLCIAYGIALIPNDLIKGLVLCAFILLSIVDIFIAKKYYKDIHKTQFREVTAFMAKDKKYPVLNDRTFWQENYYITQLGYTGPVLTSPRANVIDSILRKSSPKYDLAGFWIMDAHGAAPRETFLDAGRKHLLDSTYVMVKEGVFYDAWAQLYLSKDRNKDYTIVDFPSNLKSNLYNALLVPIWAGSVTSDPFKLEKGEYTVSISLLGTKAKDVMAHLTVTVNDQKIGEFDAPSQFGKMELEYKTAGDLDSARIKLTLDNDFMDPQTKDDRNAFIRSIEFIKK